MPGHSQPVRRLADGRAPPRTRQPARGGPVPALARPDSDERIVTTVMTTAREIMHEDATCIGSGQTLLDAARTMRDLGVGALPICGEDDRLQGIVTDRDIVVRCVAAGWDPATTPVSQLAQGTPFYVDAGASADEVLREMGEHRVKRMPVIDNHRLVGMISEADLASCGALSDAQIGELVGAVKSGPADEVR
jgi:CBS domain-containing protein